jgi:hypothetical protein
VVPAPLTSVVGDGGVTYTFPASHVPASVDLALEPSGPGMYEFTVGVVGAPRTSMPRSLWSPEEPEAPDVRLRKE